LLSGKHPSSTLANPTGSSARFAPPSAFNPEISNELDRVVVKAVDPNPERRFQTADEFRQAVSRFVPAGFRPEFELPALLSRYTSSRELKNKGLELLLAKARPLLEPANSLVVPVVVSMGAPPAVSPVIPTPPSSELEVPPLRRRKSRWPIVALFIAIATAAIVAGLGSVITKHPSALPELQPPAHPSPLPVPVPAPAPQVRSPESIPATQAPPRPVPPRPAPPGSDLRPSLSVAPEVPKRKPKAVSLKIPLRSSDSQSTAEQLLESAFDSFERSDLAEALEFAQMALKQGAGTRGHILVGRIAARRKDFSAAQAAFEQALRLSPGNPQATRLLEKVRCGSPEDVP
jgi:serine/threonine protein kinase